MFNQSILFNILFLSMLFILMSLFFTHLYAKHIFKGIKFWVLGALSFIISIMIYSFTNQIPEFVSFFIGNLTLALGTIAFSHGTNELLGYKRKHKEMLLILAIMFILLIFFRLVFDFSQVRRVLMSVFIIYVMINIFRVSNKFIQLKGNKYLIAHLITSSGVAILHAIRIGFIIFNVNLLVIESMGINYDMLIFALVAILFVSLMLTVTIYVNHKSIHALKIERSQLEYLSMTDFLTQLPNRRMLDHYLEGLKNQNRQFAIIITDIDEFKHINDQYGHDIGDLVIKEYANLLNQSKRPQDFIARYGGDEFILIVDNYRDKARLTQKINDRLLAINKQIEIANYYFSIKISVGIALYPADGQSIDSLIKKADDALYWVKTRGKNNVAFYDEITRYKE